MRTVILGNGIVGLSIAFRLLGRLGQNDQIVVIGEYERPGSATLAAAAMLNSRVKNLFVDASASRHFFKKNFESIANPAAVVVAQPSNYP
jgi:glycine/D-amino acid oxidase-like deaminating enzyme